MVVALLLFYAWVFATPVPELPAEPEAHTERAWGWW